MQVLLSKINEPYGYGHILIEPSHLLHLPLHLCTFNKFMKCRPKGTREVPDAPTTAHLSFATDTRHAVPAFRIREIAFGDFRLYNRRFKSAKVYTIEELKWDILIL